MGPIGVGVLEPNEPDSSIRPLHSNDYAVVTSCATNSCSSNLVAAMTAATDGDKNLADVEVAILLLCDVSSKKSG